MKALKQSSVFPLLKMTVFERSLGTRFRKYSSPIATIFAFLFVTLLSSPAHGGVFVSADGRTDTYLLLHEKLGGIPYETSDCAHSEFGPHITQQYDNELGTHVFAFHLHVNQDNDRCINYDRQRTEIKTYAGSPASLKATKNQTFIFEWKFKLDDDYVTSAYFNHIFQLKPVEAQPGGNPIFTFSLRAGETDNLVFYHDEGNGMEILYSTGLAPFKGKWISARVEARFSPSGYIDVRLSSTNDDSVLLEWRKTGINLWRSESTRFVRPKWGNYRSLRSADTLRDETILYNDFCIIHASGSCDALELQAGFSPPITPPNYDLPDMGEITPFPTNRPTSGNSILRFLAQALGAIEDGAEAGLAQPAYPAKQDPETRPFGKWFCENVEGLSKSKGLPKWTAGCLRPRERLVW